MDAHAIGDREKSALIGAGALLLLSSMVQNMGILFGGGQAVHQQPVRHHRKPVVVERERVIIIKDSRYDTGRYNRDGIDMIEKNETVEIVMIWVSKS